MRVNGAFSFLSSYFADFLYGRASLHHPDCVMEDLSQQFARFVLLPLPIVSLRLFSR
jgi:hypothetical protein